METPADPNLEALAKMIRESEAMDSNMKRTWIDTLPYMTPAQHSSLRGILGREKEELAGKAPSSDQLDRSGAPSTSPSSGMDELELPEDPSGTPQQ